MQYILPSFSLILHHASQLKVLWLLHYCLLIIREVIIVSMKLHVSLPDDRILTLLGWQNLVITTVTTIGSHWSAAQTL